MGSHSQVQDRKRRKDTSHAAPRRKEESVHKFRLTCQLGARVACISLVKKEVYVENETEVD